MSYLLPVTLQTLSSNQNIQSSVTVQLIRTINPKNCFKKWLIKHPPINVKEYSIQLNLFILNNLRNLFEKLYKIDRISILLSETNFRKN